MREAESMLELKSNTGLKASFFKARCDAAAVFRVKDQPELPRPNNDILSLNFNRLMNHYKLQGYDAP